MLNLNDKIAIVTGAAMGMGKSTAELFAKAGAKVVIADYNEEEGQKVADQIKANGGEATFIQVDVSNEEQVKHLVDKTVETYGRSYYEIDIEGEEGDRDDDIKVDAETGEAFED